MQVGVAWEDWDMECPDWEQNQRHRTTLLLALELWNGINNRIMVKDFAVKNNSECTMSVGKWQEG